MTKPVIIIGAGGHAQVVADVLRQQGREVLGYTDLHEEMHGREIGGLPVLGADDEVFARHSPDDVELAIGIGARARYSDNGLQARMRVFRRVLEKGYTLAEVHAANAHIAPDARLGIGVQVMTGAIIQPGVVVGDNTIINTGAQLDHHCKIGRHNHIAPGAILCGGVETMDGCYIGAGAVLIPNVRIGSNSLIAAGVVVSRDVAPSVTFDRKYQMNARK